MEPALDTCIAYGVFARDDRISQCQFRLDADILSPSNIGVFFKTDLVSRSLEHKSFLVLGLKSLEVK